MADQRFGSRSNGGPFDVAVAAVPSFQDGVMRGEHSFYGFEAFGAPAGLDVAGVGASADSLRDCLVAAVS